MDSTRCACNCCTIAPGSDPRDAALSALTARLTELEDWKRVAMERGYPWSVTATDRIQELEAALKPFAAAYREMGVWPDSYLITQSATYGDFRRAARVLGGPDAERA